MATLRERNRLRAKRDIESAALDLFERQSYASTTVEQIARSAGVSSATFFRYFGSKEELLFLDEQNAVDELVTLVAGRSDRSATMQALADPVAAFAHSFLGDTDASIHRATRLVMTTRELEARSMQVRLRWEHALARQLAVEQGLPISGEHVLLANLAVACLTASLWQWQSTTSPSDIGQTTLQMFRQATAV